MKRSRHEQKGRDGCRVPLPWTADGPSFGFGAGPAHLPQPAWFARFAAAVEADDKDSTLALYRRALAARRRLQAAETLEFAAAENPDVVMFTRPGGWTSVTNFGTAPVPLPAGQVVVASGPLGDGELPGETTVWLER